MKKTLLLLFALISLSAFSQKIETVYYKQEGNNIVINYDLKGKGLYTIKCYYTLDGGKSFIPLKSVSGDINKEVVSGINKKIVWNVFNDSDGIKGEIQFKIEAYKVNLKKRKQGYLSFSTGIIPGEGNKFFSLQTGRFGWRKFGLGINISLYDYTTTVQINNHELFKRHEAIYFSPVITYKIATKPNYNLIGAFQIGGLGHELIGMKFSSLAEKSFRQNFILNNPSISLINNFNHFHIIAGLKFLKFEEDFFTETAISEHINISNDISSYNKFAFIGIGYTF